MENREIWDKVSKTDPNHTKVVDFGRKFNTIDAYSQIEKATEMFGPVGVGWGWTAKETITDRYILIKCDFWFKCDGNISRFDTYECAELLSAKGRFDSDAPKKALTGAITKALSYLGFNADVFLGKFDDLKYIQERKAEVKREEQNRPQKDSDKITPAQQKNLCNLAQKKFGTETKEAMIGILAGFNARKTDELTFFQYKSALEMVKIDV